MKIPIHLNQKSALLHNYGFHTHLRGAFVFFGIVFIFLTSSVVFAQEASTTININLSDVFSIETESAANNGSVDFSYQTVEDYRSEKRVNVPRSLVITFSKDFDIKVKANGAYFENGDYRIPVNVITINPSETSTVSGNINAIQLSTSDQVLVKGASLGSKLTLDIDYIIPESKSSSEDILGKPAGNYAQTVIFTATAL